MDIRLYVICKYVSGRASGVNILRVAKFVNCNLRVWFRKKDFCKFFVRMMETRMQVPLLNDESSKFHNILIKKIPIKE